MTTSKEFYQNVYARSVAAFASQNSSNPQTVRELAHRVAYDSVVDLVNMGVLDDGGQGVLQHPVAPKNGAQAAAAGTANQAPPAVSTTHIVPAAAHFATPAAAAAPPIAPPPAITSPVATAAAPQAHGVGGPQAPVIDATPQPTQVQQTVGGQVTIQPTSQTYMPPNQAGVMNTVQQVPTPQGHSALGTSGIIVPAIQKPTNPETVVNPQGEKTITQIGGSSATFVPEQVAR